MSLIDNYTLKFDPIPCEIGSEEWKLTCEVGKNLNDFLPYLNGYIKKALYDPKANTFVFTFENHKVSVSNDKVMIARIKSQEEGKNLAEKVVKFLNEIYEKKDEITPDYKRKQPPKAMDIYKLLPKTNCKKCGEPTCFVFATKLSQGEYEIEDCPELNEEQLNGLKNLFNNI